MSLFNLPPPPNARQLTLPLVAQGITFCNESTCFPCFHSLTSKSGAGSAKKTYRHPSPSRDSSVGLWFLNSSAHWRSASLWVGVDKVTWVCPWKSCRKRGMWTEVTWILQTHLSASGKKPSEEAERKWTLITSSKVLVLVKATKWNLNSGTPMSCLVPMLFVLLNYHDWKYSLYPSIQFNHIAHIYVLLAILSESVHENPHFYCRVLLLQQDWRQAQMLHCNLNAFGSFDSLSAFDADSDCQLLHCAMSLHRNCFIKPVVAWGPIQSFCCTTTGPPLDSQKAALNCILT